MDKSFKTEQEAFWAGEFGNEYMVRNQGEHLVAGNLSLFVRALSHTQGIASVIEFGANIGLNLRALRQLLPEAELAAVEINDNAAQELEAWGQAKVHRTSILNFTPDRIWDLVLVKGVLIHINPDFLSQVYDKLHQSAHRYICIAEYYNPTPVQVTYRGQHDRLFKRDFTGEMLDRFSDLRLLDYGFSYHRDPNFPQDDFNWFLLERTGSGK